MRLEYDHGPHWARVVDGDEVMILRRSKNCQTYRGVLAAGGKQRAMLMLRERGAERDRLKAAIEGDRDAAVAILEEMRGYGG